MMIFNLFYLFSVVLDKTSKDNSDSIEQLASVLIRDRQHSDLRITGSSGISCKQSQLDASKLARKKIQSSKNSNESPVQAREASFDQEDIDPRQSAIISRIKGDSSSRVTKSDIKSNQKLPSSSFLHSSNKSQDSTEKMLTNRNPDKEFPKPAPRSTQSSTKQTPSPAITTFATSTSGGSTSVNATGAKRINNLRQNHGRAVAPPQLPTEMSSSPGSIIRSDNIEHIQPITNDSVSQIMGDDNVVDFSQSPIARRLLKQSKDYKGSLDTQFPD